MLLVFCQLSCHVNHSVQVNVSFTKLSSQNVNPVFFKKHFYKETYKNQRKSGLEVCHLFEILVLAVCGFVHKPSKQTSVHTLREEGCQKSDFLCLA